MNIDFENIREEFTSFTQSLKLYNQTKLISFAFELDNFDPLTIVDRIIQNFDDIFVFGTPHNERTLIGINWAVELSDRNSKIFRDAISNYSYFKNNNIRSRNDALTHFNSIIFCSVKFDPAKNNSLWKDFISLRLYVPEIIFSFGSGKAFVCYNFLTKTNENLSGYLNKLEDYLNSIFGIGTKEKRLKDSTSDLLGGSDEELNYWNNSVTSALEKLKDDQLKKIVLSRVFNFTIKHEIKWYILLQKLKERFPDCYLFFLKKNDSIFFGSSPEMFLKITDKIAEVESVAGSAPRGDKSESDKELEKFLRSSEKNHKEHLFVSDFISDILIQYSNDVRIIEEKQIRKLDNIQHLITKILAVLNTKENIFELIDSLFPTPAVCGVPKDEAMKLIRALEKHDRGLYSGLVGVFDFEGNCELAVSIRSALVKGNQVTAFAGAGLLKNSDPEEEFQETNLKLNTILSLFENENKN
ncbi:MAG: isochorismate synthase [bacterium]|nr:isochorismate synthase [bacterium]